MTDIPEDVMKAAGDAILKGGTTLRICDDLHLAVARAIMAERERSQWQPIETAPKYGERIIIAGDGESTIGWWKSNVGRTLIASDDPYWEPYDFSYWDRCETGDWFEPTHWMPLPKPPEAS